MQQDPALAGLPREVVIHGVNGVGHEAGNGGTCAGRTIPWLQDVVPQDVWNRWQVNYRDVVVLDEDNVLFGIYNLTVHDLAVAGNYADMRDLLVQAATAP
jgi:hypothetical protein